MFYDVNYFMDIFFILPTSPYDIYKKYYVRHKKLTKTEMLCANGKCVICLRNVRIYKWLIAGKIHLIRNILSFMYTVFKKDDLK